ncbi:hypothetical protein K492DRAFT_80957 [Lichtheimia hyalospora FSU 10163]|nr:hypothetical protein K492DRAFT_80957 [Lichtheimia hyalospora FSU 10163]
MYILIVQPILPNATTLSFIDNHAKPTYHHWNISTIALAHHLHKQHSSTPDHRFTLIIPPCRRLIRGQCNDISNVLIKAINQLKLHLDTIPFNVSTVLHLPLNTIWRPTPGHNPTRQGYKKLLVKDIFYFNLSTNHVHFRPWTVNHHHHTRNKFLAEAFSQHLSQQQITLVQFFFNNFSQHRILLISMHSYSHGRDTHNSSCGCIVHQTTVEDSYLPSTLSLTKTHH